MGWINPLAGSARAKGAATGEPCSALGFDSASRDDWAAWCSTSCCDGWAQSSFLSTSETQQSRAASNAATSAWE